MSDVVDILIEKSESLERHIEHLEQQVKFSEQECAQWRLKIAEMNKLAAECRAAVMVLSADPVLESA